MREWKIICDHCGVEITGNPFAVTLERVGREEDAPVIGETYRLDLCKKCADNTGSGRKGNFRRTSRMGRGHP